MQAEQKLIKARTGLVLSSPFFASIALHLTLLEDKECKTAYTDSVVLGYNPIFIESLTLSEVKAVICHEVMHVVMLHIFRMQERNHRKWNIACDYAVNLIVRESGFTLPEGALLDEKYKNQEAEVIYNQLPDEYELPLGKQLIGDVKPYKQTNSSKQYQATPQQQAQDWKLKITQAAAIAKAQGKLPQSLDRMITEIMQPKLPWKEILARFITEHVKNDYTWTLPNKRYLHANLYLPALQVPSLGTIAVIIDTSGSVNQADLEQFAGELQAILMSYPATEILIIYVDSKVAHTEAITIQDLKLHAKGGGGTDFRPGFAYIKQEQIEPSCVLYFTDGCGNSFPEAPDYPTLWIITDKADFAPPFGEVVRLVK
jgi:predicted metal-dependent peptidase